MSAVPSNSDDLVKARSMIETLMRHALAIDKETKEISKCLRQATVAIERQSIAMANALRREMSENPDT